MKFPFLSMDDQNKNEIQMISIEKIFPNPYQPRKDFNEEDIQELAESIENFGLLQPLTLRKKEEHYELIAGERRLRAAEAIDLNKVPCIVNDFNDEEMAEIALVENLQRKDLDFIEESLAYSKLINKFNLTQQELAKKLGKSQSTIANKLRILNLPEKIRAQLKSPTITERHARALLKLTNESNQLQVIKAVNKNELTVRETEELIDEILNKKTEEDESESNNKVTVYKDLRLFKNTLKKTISEMKEAGLNIKVEKNKDEDYIYYNICLPRQQKKSNMD